MDNDYLVDHWWRTGQVNYSKLQIFHSLVKFCCSFLMGILDQERVPSGDAGLLGRLPCLKETSSLTINELESLCQLRTLIEEDDTIKSFGIEDDDEFLLAFIRGRKGNVGNAFETLQNFVHVRKVRYAKFFSLVNSHNFRYIVDGSTGRFSGILRHTDRLGRVVGVIQYSLLNHDVHKGEDVIQAGIASAEELLRMESVTKHGMVLVVDGSGFGYRHAKEVPLSRLYMLLQIFLNAFPVQYKAMHILNNSYIFDTILAVIRKLLPKKLKGRIFLHGNNYSSLHEHVPREILPLGFQGTLTDEEAYNREFDDNVLARWDYREKAGI